MQATVSAIEYFLPERTLSTADLAAEFPEWRVEKIDAKTGISTRHVSGPEECSSDLAVAAAQELFQSGACRPDQIDFLLLCTQSPDYFVPTTACLLQDRLGIPTTAGALDFSLGSSGYVYGLGIAQGLISSDQASRILLLTAETYSKFLHPQDRSVRTIFGDAATATLVVASDAPTPLIGPFVYGTDGSGGPNLIVPSGGMRRLRGPETGIAMADESGNVRSPENLFMDGGEIFNFTLAVAPQTVHTLLDKSQMRVEDIDLFIFHQANKYILEHLRKRMHIPADKFQITMSHCGNTCSSSIPIALKHACIEGKLREGSLAMLVGFGPGYSWGAALLRCAGLCAPPVTAGEP
jgi:3-oxoacyl-[acyl-carrier-protein] synthase III